MTIDTLTADGFVLVLTYALWIAGGALALLGALFAGALWQYRRPSGTRAQRREVDHLAARLADSQARARVADEAPARLRHQLFDAQRDRIMAEENAVAYAHRAERERARADAAVSRCADLVADVIGLQAALERALTAGRRLRDGVESATERIVLAELEAHTEWQVEPQ